MAKNPLAPFEAPFTPVRTNEVLTALFRDLMKTQTVTKQQLHYRITRAEQNQLRHQGSLAGELSSRINHRKQELQRRRMTWNVFCHDLPLLGISEFYFEIQLKHRHRLDTLHSVHVEITPRPGPGGKGKPTKIKRYLSILFRQILIDLAIGHEEVHRLMEAYLADPANRIAQNAVDKAWHRGNLRNELGFKPPPRDTGGAAHTMTWNVLCKGLIFLQYTDIEVAVRLPNSGTRVSRAFRIRSSEVS